MSWQHPHEGDDPVIPEVVYDPQQAIGAYDGYADPATVHGWRESATETPAAVPETAPLPAIPEGPDGSAVFVDGSGRRRRLMRRGGIGLGAACVVFLGIVVAGLFGSSPSGGPLPWSDGHDDQKQQRAEHSAPPSTSAEPATSDAAPSPSASPSKAPTSASADEKDTSPTSSASTTTTGKAPTTTAPTTTAPSRGNSANNPGRGNGSPGATKGPK
ncbi:hypothetical protein ACIBL6_43155 [Streptomyces sp. NPDC050400]|uniref:hypothetical protein n=1 Tax=Streptomyces sp. NPDC050400 TaxID=3365610 RepID=UPI003790EE1C